MKNLWTLTQREIGGFFLSPIAYMVLIGMLAVSCLNFWFLLTELSELRIEAAGEASPMVRYVAANLWFWLSMLIMVPVATMRLIAEEKRSGTIEVLMTAPVTDLEVVLSKFIGCVAFYCTMWTPSVIFLVVLRQYGNFEFDWWPLYAVYLGVFTVGLMFLSVGLFYSSLTRNQIVAAILTFATVLIMFSTFLIHWYLERNPSWSAWAPPIKYSAVLLHLIDFGTGKMEVKYLAFHLSVMVFMLFLTTKIVEARKWR